MEESLVARGRPEAHRAVAIRRLALAAIVALFSISLAARAGDDTDDDTLRFYLSKSKLVVYGEFVSDRMALALEAGVVHLTADFRIDDVIKGRRRAGETIGVDVKRYDSESLIAPRGKRRPGEDADVPDWPKEVKRGAKCILFLDADGTTADVWFGIQPPYPTMIKSLKRLVAGDAEQGK